MRCHKIDQVCELWSFFWQERAFGQNVSYLFRGVDVFDWNSSIQILSVKQPIQVRTVGSGDMSRGRTPVFYDNSDHSIVFFGNKQRRSLAGDVWVWKTQSILSFDLLSVMRDFVLETWCSGDSRKSSTTSHKLSAGILSNLRAASTEMTSASVLLCENPCLLIEYQIVKSEFEILNWYQSHRARLIQYFFYFMLCNRYGIWYVIVLDDIYDHNIITFSTLPESIISLRDNILKITFIQNYINAVDQTLNWSTRGGINNWVESVLKAAETFINEKIIEVLIVLNWSSDVRRSSLNCRFSDIRISVAQNIISCRRSHPNLTWAFRDKVQRSDLNILFQYLFPWY